MLELLHDYVSRGSDDVSELRNLLRGCSRQGEFLHSEIAKQVYEELCSYAEKNKLSMTNINDFSISLLYLPLDATRFCNLVSDLK